jgi:membrane-associated phospholipid phosphatase
MLLAWILLCGTRQYDRLAGVFGALTLATIVTLAVSALLPAVGAYAFHGVSNDMLASMRGTGAGAWHVKDFLAVREGTLRYLDPKAMEGITQFPSFHTVVAATAGWATWRTRWAKWPMALFSAAVIWTTLPIGGHYVIDVIAGLAVTAMALWVMARTAPDHIESPAVTRQGLETA